MSLKFIQLNIGGQFLSWTLYNVQHSINPTSNDINLNYAFIHFKSHLRKASIAYSHCNSHFMTKCSFFFSFPKTTQFLIYRLLMFVCLFMVYRPTRESFTHFKTSLVPVKGCKFWPLSSEGSLACHTYCDTGHPFIMVIFKAPLHSHLLPCVKQWSCRYLF